MNDGQVAAEKLPLSNLPASAYLHRDKIHDFMKIENGKSKHFTYENKMKM